MKVTAPLPIQSNRVVWMMCQTIHQMGSCAGYRVRHTKSWSQTERTHLRIAFFRVPFSVLLQCACGAMSAPTSQLDTQTLSWVWLELSWYSLMRALYALRGTMSTLTQHALCGCVAHCVDCKERRCKECSDNQRSGRTWCSTMCVGRNTGANQST